ncbi:MAG TPA: hypothetical protein DIW46_01595 [Microbacterium sp.]|uniref:hypothetical protein n=1 Tax=Microbacterium sp. TaxID=51671 RepID=UPI000ECD94B4|nr:hypothetical protein [Microbacterium sp.]
MDRTVVFSLSAPIPRGHLIEVSELISESGTSTVIAIVDLESGVRFERSDLPAGEIGSWKGTVQRCTVSGAANRARTSLIVDPARPGAAEAGVALRGADAAAEAASEEALRWGGVGPEPEPEPPRFW